MKALQQQSYSYRYLGQFCKTIRVSGRQGSNSIINGVYEHGGTRFGLPYYV